jgi:hypothetical protein
VHPDAPSRRSTSCWSVALALAVRPVTASREATTRRPDCTGSTAPMSCIRMRRLNARLLVSRSHWLSSCARSIPLCVVTTRLAAATNLLCLRRAMGCLGMSRGSSRGLSSNTSPRAGSSSTTSPTPRVRVPRHVARLITRLVVDYSVRRDFVLRTH